MADANSTESPLGAVGEAAGPHAIDAFSVLGNETRLSILLALWESFEPWAPDNAVPFSELRERLGRPDSGQFNYHLGRLAGQFVRKTDRGYELRRAGHQVVRTVLAGAGGDELTLDPTEIDPDCPQCGAQTAITYADGVLMQVCTECDGRFGARDPFPGGGLAAAEFDPAGVPDRGPQELFHATWIRAASAIRSALEGVCDACSGPMDRWLHVCDDHASDGVCPTCQRRDAVVARFRCSVCKQYHEVVPWCSWLVMHHPAVIAFYYERGVSLQYDGDVGFQPRQALALEADHDYELVSEDPPRVRVTIRHEGDELQLTFDEAVNVIDVRQPD